MFLKDRSTLSGNPLINPPKITNKGGEYDREVGTKEKTNLKEVANNPTLPITMDLFPLHKTLVHP